MRFKVRRQRRYNELIGHHFLPFEARVLSRLAKHTPALRIMIRQRDEKWARFIRKEERRDTPKYKVNIEWRRALRVMYCRNRWMVQEGPKGRQRGPTKGQPNAWAMYRSFIRTAADKGYKSPWEKRQLKQRRSLDLGQVVVKRAERAETVGQLRRFLEQLAVSIAEATGVRRQQLVRQRDRLRTKLRSLEGVQA